MKQIILKNNVIDIYKNLKNDKEKSQFLLKIFKYLIENDDSFDVKEKINFAFMGIKPSLKISESGGGNNNPSGKNQHNVEDTLTYENLGQSLNKNISIKEEKNISNKEISIKEKKEKEKEGEQELLIDYDFAKKTYDDGIKNKVFNFTNFDDFWIYYKDKGILKSKLHNTMIRWDIRWNDEKKKNQPLTNDNLYGQFKYL